MDSETVLNLGLVLAFVLVGGVFAAAEMALVSLREDNSPTSSDADHAARA